jgi:hypothetical protein
MLVIDWSRPGKNKFSGIRAFLVGMVLLHASQHGLFFRYAELFAKTV